MFSSVVYHRSSVIGEVEIHPKNSNLGTWTREIRISYISHPPSDRCSPLAVLHTISTSGVCFRMESKSSADESLLFSVYSACLRENKTAVASIGEEELHLVAMPSRRNIPRHSCFWGYIIARGLYNSCLVMLNHRCLGIVFDLDETLLVANTMRSLEDKIDGLQRMISSEMDPQRANGMLAVIKRYQDDKSILKQYVDGDQVVENGKVFKTQSEAVPPLLGSNQLLTRPIIRLHEKNIILTRVNPSIRDTSVLVRLRPAWEDLRNYLTANGRKWFEFYVCTMAEREYALEMWRLLDPECNLINSSELLDRIVCVKSGLRKSLFSVFQDGVCHPKMSLVIDDRLEVWDEKDQSRVLVVPPFAPHFGPQAEANNDIPVLCAARNLACNVRGSFFKDFDEVLSPRMSEIFYEDEVEYPSAPDVGNYLIPKGANRIGQSIPPIADNFDTRAAVPPGPTVITPTAPAVSLTTTQFPNTVVPATATAPQNKPLSPGGLVLTQLEKRRKRKPQLSDAEASSDSSEEFPLQHYAGNPKDLAGKPTVSWAPEGECVQVSTSLPYWGSEKVSRHALAAITALYGRRTLRKLKRVPEEDLPHLAAQVGARSLVTNHFLALSYKRLIAANKHLETEKAELKQKVAQFEEADLNKYHIDNPAFQDVVLPHIAKGIDTSLDRLRERGGLAPGFETFQFPDVYPALKKKLDDINRKAKGKDKADSSSSGEEESEEGESEDEAAQLEENKELESEDTDSFETGGSGSEPARS